MDENARQPRRWFQFTISSILWATAWMAICFGLTAAWGWHEFDHWAPMVGTMALIGLLPFIAAGVLFGRPLIGFAVGLIVVSFCAGFVAFKLAG